METSHVKPKRRTQGATLPGITGDEIRGGEPWTAQGVYWEEKEAMVCVR